MAGRKTVTVIGAGGNIGSHLVPHLGRMANVGRVLLIDRDRYERANLAGQDITAADVGRRKAAVQAARLRRINPALEVEAAAAPVESVPLGALRADVMLACLDTRAARQWVNEAAWRLGTAWVDAGVEPGGLLARVTVYVPGREAPCLECAWDERDYAALEQAYPCGDSTAAAATRAPSSLGALAASLQAIECARLLGGGQSAAGRQVLVDAAHQKIYASAFRRNPACRFDHRVWRIRPLAGRGLSVEDLLELGEPVRVDGRPFVRRLACPACGAARRLFRPAPVSGRCARCGGAMRAAGTDLLYALDRSLEPRLLRVPLRRLGIRDGDVVSAGGKHYEIGGAAAG